jgi:hypothetical protein
LLGEDQLAVGNDVELALLAGDRLGLVRRLLVELGRETRGPVVIAVSDRAVENVDARHSAMSLPSEVDALVSVGLRIASGA